MVYEEHVVVQLVKALCYKLETSQVLIPIGVIGIFSLTQPFWPPSGTGVN
jgi:hypothetical protein